MSPIDRQATFSGTSAVADELAFDLERLAAHLAAHLPAVGEPLAVAQFKGGQSNPTYLVETTRTRLVLRRKPPGRLLPSAHAVDREYRVLSALFAHGFPVPRPLLWCGEDDVIGTPFYLMHYVAGRVFWEPTMPEATPAERAAVYDAMNATLARLHRLDPAALGLADFGRGENYVARQVERWTRQYRASQTGTIAAMEELIAWLPGHLPPPAPMRLVHGDYRLDNLILAPDRPEVAAVLDWELSTLGDPLADFTYHLMQWDMPPSETGFGVGTLVGADLGALGLPSRNAYVDAYVARTGLDPRPHLPVYLAYNFFRIAAILQGIVKRAEEGTASNRTAAGMAEMVRPLAEVGLAFARQASGR